MEYNCGDKVIVTCKCSSCINAGITGNVFTIYEVCRDGLYNLIKEGTDSPTYKSYSSSDLKKCETNMNRNGANL